MAPSSGALDSLVMTANPGSSKPNPLEIHTPSTYIVFKGRENVTTSQTLTGYLQFTLDSSIKPKSITVTFEGFQQTQHFVKPEEFREGFNFMLTHPLSPSPICNRIYPYRDTQTLKDENGNQITKIPSGTHRFNFSFDLPGDLDESVEGLRGQFRTYTLDAKVTMGPFARDLKASQKMKVIRTIGEDLWEEMVPETIPGTWPDKIRYEISTASRCVVYGDRLKVDFELTPLAPKLQIGRITMSIKEVMKSRTEPGPQDRPNLGWGSFWRKERTDIAKQVFIVPEDCEENDPGLGLPMKKFSLFFELPRSLRDCRQSVEHGKWLQVKHNMHYNILLHNADGHKSELRAHHAIRLFLHPNHHFDEDCNITGSNTAVSTEQLTQLPPGYGAHLTDSLAPSSTPYDPFTGLTSYASTPGTRSGATTPTPARNLSVTGIAGMVALPPEDLHAALQNVAGRSDQNHPLFQANQNTDQSPVMWVEHVDWDLPALSRIVSYDTAVRTPALETAANGPPTYDYTTSRPNTPPG